MFKRVYLPKMDGFGPVKVIEYFRGAKTMESSPLTKVGDEFLYSTTVEEYEDGNLLRSYEYFDPTRSVEATPVFDKRAGLRVSVYINTRDEHGGLDNDSSPAHVHVFNNNGIEVGEVNINGNCPRNGQDVVMYRAKNQKAFNQCRSDIALWANTILTPNKLKKATTGWNYAKYEWARLKKLGITK
jgi:hypothetical protein